MKNQMYKFQLAGFYKSQIKILLSILLFVSMSSCSDFIEIPQEDAIDSETFFSNANELAFAGNGVYASMRSIYDFNLFYIMQEGRGDNVRLPGAEINGDGALDVFDEIAGNNILSVVWINHYGIINNANTVISKAPNVPFETSTDQELIQRTVGEVKFLRALTYFNLVTMWGDIPLRTSPTTDFDNADVARSPVADVYEQIISDLTDAANVLPTTYSGGSFNEVGRVTSLAAQALLGKVYLQNGNPAAAASTLENVIGQYSLLENYSDLYAPGNDNTAESIFEINFNPTNGTGMRLNNFFIPSSVASDLGIVAGGFAGVLPYFPTNDVVSIFEPGDLRSEASFSFYDDGGVMKPYISKFIDLDAAAEGSNINLIVLRYADVLLMKAEADGESATSYEYINQVRRRAFGQNPFVADPAIDINSSSSGTFFEKVQRERRREFAFEGQRWIDLLRYPESELIAIINNHLATEYVGEEVSPIDAHNLIYPIPQFEIDVTDGLVTQNPGY